MGPDSPNCGAFQMNYLSIHLLHCTVLIKINVADQGRSPRFAPLKSIRGGGDMSMPPPPTCYASVADINK